MITNLFPTFSPTPSSKMWWIISPQQAYNPCILRSSRINVYHQISESMDIHCINTVPGRKYIECVLDSYGMGGSKHIRFVLALTIFSFSSYVCKIRGNGLMGPKNYNFKLNNLHGIFSMVYAILLEVNFCNRFCVCWLHQKYIYACFKWND